MANHRGRETQRPGLRSQSPGSAGWTVHSFSCHLARLSSAALDCPSSATKRLDGPVASAHPPPTAKPPPTRALECNPPVTHRDLARSANGVGCWHAPCAHGPPFAIPAALGDRRIYFWDPAVAPAARVLWPVSDSEGERKSRWQRRRVPPTLVVDAARPSPAACVRSTNAALWAVGRRAQPRVRSVSRRVGLPAAGCDPPPVAAAASHAPTAA